MASSPITSWQIEGEKVETRTGFIFLGSKIPEDGDCNHEIKRRFLLGRKAMTNWGSILKSRGITLPTKVHLVKAIVSPIFKYGCESQTINKAECQRVYTFKLWYSWESPAVQGDLTSPSWRKSTLNIYWKVWCWSSNTLATWCEELTHWKRSQYWERLRAIGEGGGRGWGG